MTRQLKTSEVEGVLKQLVARQGNKCGVCGLPFTRTDGACLDHDHNTGYIRGALHRSCNGAEGRVKTKAQMGHKGVTAEDYVIGLGKYLEQHKTPKIPLLHPLFKTEDQARLLRNAKARRARAKKKEAG